MLNPEIEKYRGFSDWFLKMFAIEVVVLGQENWDSLSEDAHNLLTWQTILRCFYLNQQCGKTLNNW